MESESRKKPGRKPKPIPTEKTCNKCAQTKPFSAFLHHRNTCTACVYKERRELYVVRKEVGKGDKTERGNMESGSRKKPGPKPKPIPTEKTCKKCAQTKPTSEFPPHRNSCTVCVYKERRELYVIRKEVWKAGRDKEKARQACRRWRAKHGSEYQKNYHKRTYAANKEAMNAKSREYKRQNKARLSFMVHKYRAKKHGVLASATHEEWLALCVKYHNRCLCCGEQKPLTVDHVIPMVLGGTHTINNLQPLSKECHTKKSVRMTDYRPAGAEKFTL